VSTLDDLTQTSGPGGMAGFVTRLSQRLRPVRRRDVLVGATVAATALATKPKEYALRPVAAYATICGPGNTASSGWTVFCCTVNKGVNACPPGSFAAGWWKAADSSWCGNGYRYIVDCNASCSKCTSGCSDGICDSRCWSCSCGTGSSATCDQRRICCNAFRYGQCNTQVKCSGGVHCRVVSCVAPYKWASCTTTSLTDNRTSEHSAPCIPQWGAIENKYKQMGAQGSFLKASTSPIRLVGDGKGSYVTYQGGITYYTRSTRAHPMTSSVKYYHDAEGGPRGERLGYPVADRENGLRDGGWLQRFENGVLVDSKSTSVKAVWGTRWVIWQREGREGGNLRYPVSAVSSPSAGTWIQTFQNGAIVASPQTPAVTVWGTRWVMWQQAGREGGRLGYPTGSVVSPSAGTWTQAFQKGAITASPTGGAHLVEGVMWSAWRAAGQGSGVLRYPTGDLTTRNRGLSQTFQGGELWALGSGTARRVYGAVLAEWNAAGGATGTYGYPVGDTGPTGDGRLTCTFEGGTITA
jgi:uncharacterized protein with LGFP repeats